MEKYKIKKRRVEELEEQLQHLEKALASLAEDESSKLNEVADIEARINGINQELVEQERKRDRAHKHCLKYVLAYPCNLLIFQACQGMA